VTDGPILSRLQKIALKQAEDQFQKMLFELEEETGLTVEFVSVDTRNYGQLKVSIDLTEETRA
jgi:hypothetical protein